MRKCNVYFVVWLLIVTILVLQYPLFGQTKKKEFNIQELSLTDEEIKVLFEKKKDPLFAGILSFYMPGLGQFYSDEKLKGAIFLVTEYTIVIGSLFYFLDFNFKAGSDSGFNLTIDAKRTDLGVISTKRKYLFYSTLAMLSVIHVYNIIDAVQSAGSFNTSLQQKRHELIKKYPQLNFGYNADGGIYFGLSSRY
ncbi:MAG: hypothetical protein N3F66_06250 [Spirochaetes bacterium]|nr:hypothetical protein [Spirochaetota bacterium]